MDAAYRDQQAATGWREQRSPNFRVLVPIGSLAEPEVGRLAERLEALRNALNSALALKESAPEPIDVLVQDDIVSQGPAGVDESQGARYQGQIRATYSSDGRAQDLERSVIELLLARALRPDVAQIPALVDGILGHVVQQLDGVDMTSHRAAVAIELRVGRLKLADLLEAREAAATPAYRQAITLFVSFLLEVEGAERFQAFVRTFDAAQPNRAADEVYGRPLPILERAWLRSLRSDAPQIPRIVTFLRRSAVYLRPYWKMQVLILAGTLFGAGFAVVQPLAFHWLIDRAIVPGDFAFLGKLMGGLAVLFVLQAAATLAVEYLNARTAAAVLSDIRLQLFRHLQRLSMGFHTTAQVGDLMSRLSSDLYVIRAGMTGALVQVAYLALTVTASAVLLLALEWRLGLLALAVAPLVLLGPKFLGGRAAAASYQLQQETASVASVLQENLGAQLIVKAFGLEESGAASFRVKSDTLARSTIRAMFLGTVLGLTGSMTVTFIQLLTLGVGAYMVIGGSMTLGSLMAFTGLLGNVLGPIQGISDLFQNLQLATGGLRRVEELLEEEPQVVDLLEAIPLPRPSREIRFDGVTFSYTGDQVNLREASFMIPAGSSVAFVGPSGCGKSTVLSLILRLYDPTIGTVQIDGHDLRRVTQQSLRSQVALVPQDTFLFNTSVRENIRVGRPDAADAEIEAAARAAEIHDIVVALPQGYDTAVGERGVRLSGGQRQRVALARAVLRDAPILLLDEATSALDPQSEASINTALARLAKGRTTVRVTHQLASVVTADRIYVLDQGRLVEQGPHDDLLRQGGLYSQLWHQQGAALDGGARLVAEVSQLQAVPLFASLEGVLLAALARELVTERFGDGHVIVAEGQPGDRLYMIVEGQVEVVTLGPAGVERRLAVLRRGDYFGEMSLLTEAPRSATVRARGQVALLALGRAHFASLLERLPGLRDVLTEAIEARKRAALLPVQAASEQAGAANAPHA